MGKKLLEMTKEELWQLFPIYLVEHKNYWANWYAEELSLLKRIFPDNYIARISHIGSTAIVEIWAKPIVDILVEIRNEKYLSYIKGILLSNGYLCMAEDKKRISLNKGYTEEGFAERVYHLHLRCLGDNDELYFRDYLKEYSDIAKEYESLKLALWKEYEHDRDGYTGSKTAFIREQTIKAKEKYKGRYG
jgi:GrpB-like predicted nucleotidyltransferase (UPF0157 family)